MDTTAYAKQLEKQYRPQKDLLRAQYRSELPVFQAQEQALKQAQKNAFRDIANTANASGMLYSGATPEEMNRYTGEKFLPAMAELKQGRQKLRLDLLSALTGLDSERLGKVTDYRTNRVNTLEERRYNERMADREFAREKEMMNLQASLSSRGGGGSRTTAGAAPKPTLNDLYDGYEPSRDLWYTERVVIPQLISNYGYSAEKAAEMAYGYRKNRFGE